MLKEFNPEFINSVISIISIVITGFLGLFTIIINKKALKLPQVINISKLLVEEVFSFGLLHIESNLYLPLTFSIQKDLIHFRKHIEKHLIYLDREFVRVLNNICDANYSAETEFANNLQADYQKFSILYFQALNTSRKNLGLTKYRYDFRMNNDLYYNPKISKILKKIDRILKLLLVTSILLFIISILFFPNFTTGILTLTFLLIYCSYLFRSSIN